MCQLYVVKLLVQVSQHLFGLSTLSLGHLTASISRKIGKIGTMNELNEHETKWNKMKQNETKWNKMKQRGSSVQVGMYYANPVKLDATERTVETSAELCQQRCQVMPDCSHFTFWPDPGTGLFRQMHQISSDIFIEFWRPPCTSRGLAWV